MEKKDRFLKVSEVAEMLGLTKMAVYLMVSRREITNYKLGNKKLRFRESDIINFINNSRRPAAQIIVER
ncbi:MAG: helix-turn-helix domain-containing protein [Syntrophorhabdaceae bacterium]|nr:helix-turn-helix domain-containing protein [Syntrophorhabdaceae bacterium]